MLYVDTLTGMCQVLGRHSFLQSGRCCNIFASSSFSDWFSMVMTRGSITDPEYNRYVKTTRTVATR